MHTYFAPAERATAEELAREIAQVSAHTILSSLLHSVSGVLAIINEQRQIVAVNAGFLKMLGIDDPETQLGLRPGESLQCCHAETEPGGCGTSQVCASCGAAIAIVSSLEGNCSTERECAIRTRRSGSDADIALRVRSHPIDIDGIRYLMLFLQDITMPQKRAALERTFFHDINNHLGGLLGMSQLLTYKQPGPLVDRVFQSVQYLIREVAIQKSLMLSDSCFYQPEWKELTIREILDDLETFFGQHLVARGKQLQIEREYAERVIRTDRALLQRVLCNMLINAFEASEAGAEVQLWVRDDEPGVTFCVWNDSVIPEAAQARMFQRNFSTKPEAGRGIGTFSMKLFGEEILGGQVSFASTPTEGTLFQISLAG